MRNTIRNIGIVSATALCSAAAQEGSAVPARQPNVILLFTDDMNYSGPSCYGSRWDMPTPAIDRLAAEGVRCTDAYVSGPTCGPSRMGLMTGRMQTRFGAEFNGPRKEGVGLPLSEKTLADRMKALGYATGLVGKWHLGGDENVGAEYHPHKRGFDYFYGFYGSMVHFFRSAHIFRGMEQVKDEGYLTDILAQESCDFIKRNADRPFFLYTAFNAVHTPLEAAEEDLAAVCDLPPPACDRESLASLKGERLEKMQQKILLRRAMLRGLDRAVARIMQQLKESGLDENTLVIFMNDNGDYTQNLPFSGGKGIAMEGGVRVPFILRWPGRLPAGNTYGEMVSALDILPTAVAAGGGAIDPAWNLDGVDLLPYLNGEEKGIPHEWLFWRMGGNKAARSGTWKLYYSGSSGFGYSDPNPRWSLFNLADDPAEQLDLKAEFPEQFAAMRKAFDAWEAEQAQPLWPFGPSGQMGQWKSVGVKP